jgi:hypothetical protein
MAHLYYVGPIHLDPKNFVIQTVTLRADCRMRVLHQNRYRARRLDIRQFAVMKMKRIGDTRKFRGAMVERSTFGSQKERRVFLP